MKRIVLVLLAITPIFVFSQKKVKNEINWMTLKEAKVLAKKYNENILVYFYKQNCPYCDKMKNETLNDSTVIDIINRNFFAVKIDSRTKDTIYYNNTPYTNQQPIDHGYTWRHDFYAEVASIKRDNTTRVTTPSIVLFDKEFEKITLLPGNHPKELLIRRLKKHIN